VIKLLIGFKFGSVHAETRNPRVVNVLRKMRNPRGHKVEYSTPWRDLLSIKLRQVANGRVVNVSNKSGFAIKVFVGRFILALEELCWKVCMSGHFLVCRINRKGNRALKPRVLCTLQ
jgi:hypothetical protein